MIIDSSALVAITFEEPGAAEIQDRWFAGGPLGIGAPTLTKTAIVLSGRLRRDARGMVERMLKAAGIVVLPFEAIQYEVAISAWMRFGEGRPPASLNLGDCSSYAVAHLARRPLRCVGDHVQKADLPLVHLQPRA